MKKEIILLPVLLTIIILFISINYNIVLGGYYFNKAIEQFKINDLTGSLNNYSGSLSYFKSEEGQYNFNYIKKIIEEKEKQKQEKKDAQKNEEQKSNKKGSESDKNEEQKKEDSKGSSNSDKQKTASQKVNKQELSIEQLKQIKDYTDKLKKEEKYNRQEFNNNGRINNNPFFNDVFDRGEKDW